MSTQELLALNLPLPRANSGDVSPTALLPPSRGRLTASCTHTAFDMDGVYRHFYPSQKIERGVIRAITKGGGEMFVFEFGVVVMYDILDSEERALVSQVASCGKQRAREARDTFEYVVEEKAKGGGQLVRIRDDHLVFVCVGAEEMECVRLSVAHAAAQSVLLARFEASVADVSRRVEHLPDRLAKTGSLGTSTHELLKLQGELFVSHLSIHASARGVPVWFWENCKYEPVYSIVSNEFLGVPARIDALNSRVDRMSEMFALFREVLTTSDGARLEWIIIWLIAFEILVDIVGFVYSS